jgi:uncharacterized protein
MVPWVRAHVAPLSRAQLQESAKPFLAALHGRRFWPVVPAHFRIAIVWQIPIWFWYYFWLLGRFLLGYIAGKERWFDDDGRHRLPLFRRLLFWGLVAALPSVVLTVLGAVHPFFRRHLAMPWALLLAIAVQLGLLGTATAYVGATVLLMQRPRARRLLVLIAPAGRMPLTTYISQSVICTFLCYGWGLGWAGKLRSGACVGLAFAIFTVQVVVAHLWLRWFRFGPLEWGWRALVYLRRPAMLVTSRAR